MKSFIQFLKICWKILTFIRDIVMNFIFLFFILLVVALLSVLPNNSQTIPHFSEKTALFLKLNGYLMDNREDRLSLRNTLKELDNQHIPQQISTFDVVHAVTSAANDNRIHGLVLDLNYFEGGDLSALNYIGNAITYFKQTGKPVIVYADNYTQKQYLLASYADEIYINPIGRVEIEGMSAVTLFYKSLLDNLKVTPHVFRVGTYKSAVEPFLRDSMSAEAKANTERWLEQMWNSYKETVAKNRGISSQFVLPEESSYLAILKKLKGDATAYAKQNKLVTHIADRLTLEQRLTELFGKNSENTADLLDFNDYLSVLPDRMHQSSRNKIAVVNVEGTIVDGESYEINVGGDSIAALFT